MPRVDRSSLGLTLDDIRRADPDADRKAAQLRHAINLAEFYRLGWLRVYADGSCSLRQLLEAVKVYTDRVRDMSDVDGQVLAQAVLAQTVEAALAMPEPKRRRGGGTKHPPGVVWWAFLLVEHSRRAGLSIQDREGEGEPPAFVEAAQELNGLGLGTFTAAQVRGLWSRKRAAHK